MSRTKSLQRVGALLCFLIGASFSVFGQTYTGTITGTVTDPSGAAVPNAKVTITDVGKGFTYNAQTDNSGIFTVRSLPPSTYSETVEAPGFSKFERSNIVLQVNGNQSANAKLDVAAAGQTVTVTEAGATQLQTEDATTGQTINRTYINDLPLISRQVLDLAYLAPGVSQPPGQAYGSAGGGIQNNFVSNGGRNAQADILIDGVTATTYEQNTGFVTPLYVPSVEAVQEFNIEESNFGASIGFSSGTVVNLVTRSGTNAIHGELYDYLRNTDFDANYFFNNASGLPTPVYHQNNFGVDVGGPVIKNKLFYFFDYDGTRASTPSTGTFGVPSAAERTGDFGELCGDHGGSFNAAGLCSVVAGQVFDPYTGTAAAVTNPYGGGTLQASNLSNPGGGVRANYIPFNNFTTYASPNTAGSPGITAGVVGNLINPIAAKVMSYYPLPNAGGVPGTSSYNPYNNFNGSASSTGNNNQFDLKLDNRITDNDQISIRFSHAWSNSLGANIFGNALDAYTQGPNVGTVYSGAVNYTHTFNPTTLLTVTAGYDHNFTNTAGNQVTYPNVTLQSLGFSPAVATELDKSGFAGLPAFRLGQYSQENGNASIGGQPFAGLVYGRDVYQLSASVSKTAGNHTIQFGAEFRSHRINFTQYGEPNGLFSFNQGGTSEYSSVGGDSLASFLTGFANDWSSYEVPGIPVDPELAIWRLRPG